MFERRVGGAFVWDDYSRDILCDITDQHQKKKSLKQSVRLTEVVIRNLAHVYYEQESRTEPL